MCGIAGFIDARGASGAPTRLLRAMGDAIVHRGPDGHGEFFDASSGVGLAHRRLAIIDLTVDGAQPMRSNSGRWVISFNGEIYNYRDLRRELTDAGYMQWRSQSDTEVLLVGVEQWGLHETLRRCNGMFAFALLDLQEKSLTLARDRFGEKPLYYGWAGDLFCFASELKALRVLPGWIGEIDPVALGHLLRFAYVPAPHCIYRGLRKLPAGSSLTLRPGMTPGAQPVPRTYWSALEAAKLARQQPLVGSPDTIVSEVERALDRAVSMRMHADVPLGAFLSGGVDSSVVVASMQAQASQPVQTFSIGFTDQEFDESTHARAVARHLGTNHTELVVNPQEALEVIPRLPEIYDEPFADSSQIPTFLVAQLARRHVTVSLSGDGGDELFAGYNRHAWAPSVWRRIERVPLVARRAVARALLAVSPSTWDCIAVAAGFVLPAARQRLPGYKLHKLAGVLDSAGPEELYQRLTSFWHGRQLPVRQAGPGEALILHPELWPQGFSAAEMMMVVDAATYLPDDILSKVDRATMAVSLEARVPFLDPELYELAWRVPMDLKLRGGVGKWVLREVLYRRVPRDLIDRPKMGFGVPIAYWLRGPLRPWAEALLAPEALAKSGLLDPRPIRDGWARYLAGKAGNEYHLWNVLMFQAWLDHERKSL